MSPLASSIVPLIAVLNFSHIPNSTVQRWTLEVQRQVHEDFAPIWHMNADVVFYPQRDPPAGAWQVRIQNGPNGLGGHHLCGEDHGPPYADVFDVTPDLRTDTTLSHEVLEMLANPYDDRYVEDYPFMWFMEVVDPVEHNSYVRNGVHLADFVYPGWFNALTRTRHLDFMGLADEPGRPVNGRAIQLDGRTGKENVLRD